MALCDSPVLVRSDHGRGPLDLKRSGRIKSSSTPSVRDLF
jgi:hypothetical protein